MSGYDGHGTAESQHQVHEHLPDPPIEPSPQRQSFSQEQPSGYIPPGPDGAGDVRRELSPSQLSFARSRHWTMPQRRQRSRLQLT